MSEKPNSSNFKSLPFGEVGGVLSSPFGGVEGAFPSFGGVGGGLSIRRAVREDCPVLLAMVKELAAFERAPHEVTITLEHFTESGFGTQPVWWAFVAEADGEVVGFALYYIRFSTWKGQRLYLEDIYIRPDRRGQGIGTLLFEALVEEMKARHLHGMVWQALEWNTAALDFYKKYGARFDKEWVNCSIE